MVDTNPSFNLNLILPVGTQVVSRVEVKDSAGELTSQTPALCLSSAVDRYSPDANRHCGS